MPSFDHLIIGCATLEQGMEHVEDLTGAKATRGGAHVAMGTHNALIKLDGRTYLEIIAIDPDGIAPARPRWFELDTPAMQVALAVQPRLIAWAVRDANIDTLAARSPLPLGTVTPMARADFRWRITIPDDGMRPAGGVAPVLIQWEGDTLPPDRLPPSGLSLIGLTLAHPGPDSVRSLLDALGARDAATVTFASAPRVAAMLRTPRGLVAL